MSNIYHSTFFKKCRIFSFNLRALYQTQERILQTLKKSDNVADYGNFCIMTIMIKYYDVTRKCERPTADSFYQKSVIFFTQTAKIK